MLKTKISATVLGAAIIYIARYGVRKTLISMLNLYRKLNIFLLKLRGTTPKKETERRVVNGQLWEDFCDELKAAGATLLSPGCPTDTFTQVEGYRYLTRLTRAALENFVECSDPEYPKIVSIVDGYRSAPCKLGADNPDNMYQTVTIKGEYTYRIWGSRGTVRYLGFGTQAGSYGKPGGLKTVDFIQANEMEIGSDGTFELFVGPTRPDNCKNYLKTATDPSDGLILIRQTFGVREEESLAEMQVERIGSEKQIQPYTAEQLENGLKTTGMFVAGASLMFAKWANEFKQHVNELPLFNVERSNNVGGDPNIRYFHSYWKLEKDEALVITASMPLCESWNFQVSNHWMESLDYRYAQIHVNKFTAKYRKDGKFCIVLTHEDPNLNPEEFQPYNLLSTMGHYFGTMTFRWVKLADMNNVPSPAIEVIKLCDLETKYASQ